MLVKDIYCYYEELGNPNERPLVDYWVERWEKEGWTAHVSSLDDAKKDPRYETMVKVHSEHPHLPGHFEFGRCNYRRWLAWSSIPYSAVADYDVFPLRPFPPTEYEGFVCGSGSYGPGFIVGTGADFSKVADGLIAYKRDEEFDQWEGIPHVCDMGVLMRKTHYDKILNLTCCYPLPHWDAHPLGHFANHYLGPYDKISRVDKVKEILNKIYP